MFGWLRPSKGRASSRDRRGRKGGHVETNEIGNRSDEETEAAKTNAARQTFAATVVATAVIVVAYWLLMRRPGHNEIIEALQFAGSPSRLSERQEELGLSSSAADAREAMWLALSFSALWGAVGWTLLKYFWAGAWKAGPGRTMSGATLGVALGIGGGSLGLLEKGLTLVTVRGGDAGVRFVDWPGDIVPKAIVTLAWAKWSLAGILLVLVVAMLVSSGTAAVRRMLPDVEEGVPDDLPDESSRDDEPVVGICCSGGGIRAAGFALGALARLEEEPDDAPSDGKLGVLGRSTYLASVSGGGYAAAGWRIAAGTGRLPDEPIIGNPIELMDERDRRRKAGDQIDPAAPRKTFAEHILERRRYLSNGPGGLLRSALVVIRNMVFHFGLLVIAMVVLAWPLGRILVSWAITGDGRRAETMSTGLNTDIGIHQWFPPLAAAALAVPFLVWRLALDRSKLRTRVDVAIYGLVGMAAALTLVLIVHPVAVDWLIKALPEGGGQRVALAGVYGAIVTAVWQAAKSRLQAVARYLGGLLLGLGLGVFGLFVMAHAADTDELFSSFWLWAGCLVALIVAFVLFNPDTWSLHDFYRARLAGTFATQREEDGGFVPHPAEPALYEYRDAEGPQPVICCAAARKGGHQTGIPVLSMTFEPSCITVHNWSDEQSSARPAPAHITHAQFRRRLPRTPHGRNLHTAMGLAAISGAAVAPSLGRMSMKGTDALLAAFNARLGVWVPNPAQQSYQRSTTPRLVNMFKEIFKTYDPEDPNVYASDGGHWENLGLVELVRRRCDVIIAIDTSGDLPGTYTTFKDAIKLARLECGADVRLTDESWEQLEVSEDGVAHRNFGVGWVTYEADEDDGAEPKRAKLLYLKAAIMETTPLHIQRYASNDRRFPNYSTADQLLTEQELSHLMHLGYASMNGALEANPEFTVAGLSAALAP